MRKLILILLSLLAALYLGVKGYIWYKTREELTKLAEAMQSVAKLTYGGISSSIIHSSLRWDIAVHDIQIQPNDSNDSIKLGMVKFGTNSLLDLVNSKKIEQGALPQQARFSIDKLNLPMDSNVLNASTSSSASSPWPPYMSCGSEGALAEMKAMGYRSLETSVDAQYSWDAPAQNLYLQLAFQFSNMYVLRLETNLQLATPDFNLASLAFVAPKLSKTSLIYMDDSYLERKIRYCAVQKKLEPEAYLKSYILTLDANMRSSGLALSTQNLKDYLNFLAAPSQLQLSISPSTPIELNNLSVYSPRQIVEWLAPSIAFNEQPASALNIQWLGESGKTASSLPTFSNLLPDQVVATEPAGNDKLIDAPLNPKVRVDANGKMLLIEDQPKERVVHSYRPVSPAKLGTHIGRMAKLKMVTGKNFDGRIKAVSGNRLELEQPIQKGAARFELYLNQISYAEVYY